MSAKRRFRVWMLVPPVVLVLGLAPLCALRTGMDDRPFEMAVEELRACPRAVTLLGADVEEGATNLNCGSYESTGGHGHVDWSIPVSGRHAGGELYINGTLQGGRWTLNTLMLRVEDESVDVLACPP